MCDDKIPVADKRIGVTTEEVDGLIIHTLEPGDVVICDACDKDFTGSDESGGLLIGSYAIGPCCAARREESCKRYGEEWSINGRCPEGKSFADWVRQDLRK